MKSYELIIRCVGIVYAGVIIIQMEVSMRMILLWLIGVPISLIILLKVFGIL